MTIHDDGWPDLSPERYALLGLAKPGLPDAPSHQAATPPAGPAAVGSKPAPAFDLQDWAEANGASVPRASGILEAVDGDVCVASAYLLLGRLPEHRGQAKACIRADIARFFGRSLQILETARDGRVLACFVTNTEAPGQDRPDQFSKGSSDDP